MGKKFIHFGSAIVFLAFALSVCPCPVSAASAEVQIAKSHSCCNPQNAAHCPESKCEHKQVKSQATHPDMDSIRFALPDNAFLLLQGNEPVARPEFRELSFPVKSPPDLCIQFSTLLI